MTTEQPRPAATPPPASRRAALALVAAASLVLGSGGTWLLTRPAGGDPHDHAAEAAAPAKARYQCPMHPTVVQDHPGDCPICGMKLVALAPATASAPAPKPAAEHETYQCPMNPDVVTDSPSRCPLCGMKLVKLAMAEEAATPAAGGAPEGLVTVKIDPERQQLIGLRTVEVAEGEIGTSLRTTGRVAVDETRVHHLNVKFSGFVEHVHADFIGRQVRRGEPLFSIYSPELLAAQEELLLALKMQKALAGTRGASDDGDELVAASRRKLELWDVPAEDVARIERTGQAERTISIRSPASGVVVKKDVVPGMKVSAGEMPYEIIDLSSIWVLADVYEGELLRVKVGAPATLTLKAVPGKEFQGRVTFIDPFLDSKTRTAKVRIVFANPSLELKPEMFGEVQLRSRPRRALRVPSDAVIDSGTRSVVFVALGDGKFQPRLVRLGASDGDQVELLEGLTAGETVVTRANFLVDSESRLKASLQALGGDPQP